MSLDLTSLRRAINSLEKIIRVYESTLFNDAANTDLIEGLKAGVVQNFEFTYELSWKFMKRWLEVNIGPTVADGVARRELYRYAAENLLITDVAKWMEYNQARNITSHTYDEEKASEVVAKALEFKNDAIALYNSLEERNQ